MKFGFCSQLVVTWWTPMCQYIWTTKNVRNFWMQSCKLARTAFFWNSLIGIQFIDFNSFVRNWYCKKIQSHQTILIACVSDYQITFKILQISFWTISFLVVGLAKRCGGLGGSVSRMSLCRTYCLAISSSKDTIEPLLAIIIHNQDVSDTYNVFLISFKIDFVLK